MLGRERGRGRVRPREIKDEVKLMNVIIAMPRQHATPLWAKASSLAEVTHTHTRHTVHTHTCEVIQIHIHTLAYELIHTYLYNNHLSSLWEHLLMKD